MTTVDDYLAAAPPLLHDTFAIVQNAMPAGFELGIHFGMIGWVVPLERYPVTYNKQPLLYAALAAQKQYVALYLNSVTINPDADAAFRQSYRASGARLDMGKSCLRLRKPDDLAPQPIAEVIAGTSVDAFIAVYEKSR